MDKKSLAEAGRRKLEEFRKAKQQAKQPKAENGTPAAEQQCSPGVPSHPREAVSTPSTADHFKSSAIHAEPTTSPTSHASASTAALLAFSSPGTSVTVVTNGAIPFNASSSPTSTQADALFDALQPSSAFSAQPQPYAMYGGEAVTQAQTGTGFAAQVTAWPAPYGIAGHQTSGDGMEAAGHNSHEGLGATSPQASSDTTWYQQAGMAMDKTYVAPTNPVQQTVPGPFPVDAGFTACAADPSGGHQAAPASSSVYAAAYEQAPATNSVTLTGAAADGSCAAGSSETSWWSGQQQHLASQYSQEAQGAAFGPAHAAVPAHASWEANATSLPSATQSTLESQLWASQPQPQTLPATSPSVEQQHIGTSPAQGPIPLAHNSLADVFGGPSASSPDWSRSFQPNTLADHSPVPYAAAAAAPAYPWSPAPMATQSAEAPAPRSSSNEHHADATPAPQPWAASDADAAAWFQQPYNQQPDVYQAQQQQSSSQAAEAITPQGDSTPVETVPVEISFMQPGAGSSDAGGSNMFAPAPAPAPWDTPAQSRAATEPFDLANGEAQGGVQQLDARLDQEAPLPASNNPPVQPWSPEPLLPATNQAAPLSPPRVSAPQSPTAAVASVRSPEPEQQQRPAGRSAGRFAWLWGAGRAKGEEEPELEPGPATQHEEAVRQEAGPSTEEQVSTAAKPPDAPSSLHGTPAHMAGGDHNQGQLDLSQTSLQAGDGLSGLQDPVGHAAKEPAPLAPWQLAPFDPAVAAATDGKAIGDVVATNGPTVPEGSNGSSYPATEAGYISYGNSSAPWSYSHPSEPSRLHANQPGQAEPVSGLPAQTAATSNAWLTEPNDSGLDSSSYSAVAAVSSAVAEQPTASASQVSVPAADSEPAALSLPITRPSWLWSSDAPSPDPSSSAAAVSTDSNHAAAAVASSVTATKPADGTGTSAPITSAAFSSPYVTEPWSTTHATSAMHAPAAAAPSMSLFATTTAITTGATSLIGAEAPSYRTDFLPSDNRHSYYAADSKPEPSFLESYLDNLLHLDAKAGTQGPQEQQRRSTAGDGDASLSRRVSSSGGVAPSAEDSGTAVKRAGSGDGREAALDDGAAPGALPEGDGLASGGGSTASLGGGRPNGLPPKVPQAGGHKRLGSDESLMGQDGSGLRGSGIASSQQFHLLQQHIDELTEEKLGLQRGLAAQMRLADELAQENQALAEQYNVQAQLVEAMKKKVQQYEDELEAQVLALEGLSSERENARAVAQETAQRLSGVAAEVVSLEQALLTEKSARLRAEAAKAEATAATTKLEKKIAILQREASEASDELERVTAERRNLLSQVKLLEAKLERAETQLQQQQHRAPAHAPQPPAPAVPPAPVRPLCVDCEVQCDLLPTERPPPVQASTAAAVAAVPSSSTSQVDAVGSSQPDLVMAESQLALPSTTAATADEHGTDQGSAASHGDPPSAYIADRALAALSSLSRTASTAAGPADPLGLLMRWLPQGPISDMSPVAAVAEEEMRVVQSVHGLLQEYQQAFQQVLLELEHARGDHAALLLVNNRLQHQLQGLGTPAAASQQYGSSTAGRGHAMIATSSPEAAFSENHTFVWEGSTVAGSSFHPAVHQRSEVPSSSQRMEMVYEHQQLPASSMASTVGESSAAPVNQQLTPIHDAQPVAYTLTPEHHQHLHRQPWLDGMADSSHASGVQLASHAGLVTPDGAGQGTASSRLQQLLQDDGFVSPPSQSHAAQLDAALMTPPPSQLSYAVMPGARPGLPANTVQQQQRSGWLGFLFRGNGQARPKKRVREALI